MRNGHGSAGAACVSSEITFSRATDLSIPVHFDERGVRHFGAPSPHCEPLQIGAFSGSVASGASCNCRTITLTPHCHGTHVECAGHLTREPLDAWRVVPLEPLRAWLTTVTPEAADAIEDETVPAPAPGDRIVGVRSLDKVWEEMARTPGIRALVIRTLPNEPTKLHHDYTDEIPAYLSLSAVHRLVAAGIEHLVLDLPSLDRTHDAGHLAGHRAFFGLPAASTALGEAARGHCTITELAFIPPQVADGRYLLQLQTVALAGDAVPVRPLLLPWPPI